MIYISGLDVLETQILTLSGKYLFSSFNQHVDVSNLSKGNYIVLLITKSGKISKNLVKIQLDMLQNDYILIVF